MAFPGEVGLQLLLSPLNSNIVVRTACCSLGTVLPVYSTFKAIESRDQTEQHRWLVYWAAYGSFSIAEVFSDKILSWFPLYYHMKFAFLVWLQIPSANGARQLYTNHIRPFLLRHQDRLDRIVEFLYGEMNKFVSAHQAEFQFIKTICMKILTSGNQIVRGAIPPRERRANGSFQGQARRIQDSQSDDDDDQGSLPTSQVG